MAPSSSRNDELKQLTITAAFAGDLKVLKKLARDVDNGDGIEKTLKEIRDYIGRNVLHAAAAGRNEGKLDMVKYLVEELNFNVNEQDGNGDTPLHISTLEEDYATPAYLLDHGADPNIAMDKGFTPLHYAAKGGRVSLLRLLISKGAQVDAQCLLGTPLQAAILHDRHDAVECLLENHADPNLVCPNTSPPLLSAIYARSQLCTRVLLEWGADPNVVSRGETPLTAAASEGQTNIIKRLLDHGADPNVSNFYDVKPIEIAAVRGSHADVMALFPVTAPIPGFRDWSVRGIMERVKSDEPIEVKVDFKEEKFLEAKAKGVEAVKKERYVDAIHWFSETIKMKPTDAAVLSNRSLCWARINEGERALQDAKACIELRGDWPKAHYRAGVAYGLLRDYEKAKQEYKIALDLDPDNKELQVAYREAFLDVQAVEMYKKKQGLPSQYDVDPHEEQYQEYISSFY